MKEQPKFFFVKTNIFSNTAKKRHLGPQTICQTKARLLRLFAHSVLML